MKRYILITAMLLSASFASAGVDLPYSTSFDCDEWVETEAGDWPPNCDGVEAGLFAEFFGTSITSDANNDSNVSGTKGMRFLKGDGANDDSTIARIVFNEDQKEFWVRWYVKYETGFAWASYTYDKLIFFYLDSTGIGGISASSITALNLWSSFPSTSWNADIGFQDIWGGGTAISDGSWHFIEVHVKMDTDGTDGVGQVWIDGVLKIDEDDISWSTDQASVRANGFDGFMFDHNQSAPGNSGGIGTPAYIDYDDIAISLTGYIGPVVGAITTTGRIAISGNVTIGVQ